MTLLLSSGAAKIANMDGAKIKRPRGNPAWVKGGPSPNPHGSGRVVEEFRSRCRRAVDETIISKWLAEVECQGPDWMRASELLAAYGYGKPTQPSESKVEIKRSDVREMSRDELMAVASGAVTLTQ